MKDPILNEVYGILEMGDPEGYKVLPFRQPYLLKLRVESYTALLKAREQYRHPKDKEYTDFDRKTMLEAHVAELQEQYELAKGLEELVKQRLELYRADTK